MSFVAVNVLTVPPEAGTTLEQRFAARAGAVDHFDGFEEFQLLRPLAGTDSYLVYTRWRTQEDFESWQASQDFRSGHSTGSQEDRRPAATGSELWTFTIAQHSTG